MRWLFDFRTFIRSPTVRPISLDVEGSDIYVAGLSILGDTNNLVTYPGPRYFYGFDGSEEGLVVKVQPRCIVSVDEGREAVSVGGAVVSGEKLILHLSRPAYVGYDLYSTDGRLIDRRSLGYLLTGRYEYHLKGLPKGTYILKVRIGNHLTPLKVLISR